MTDRDTRLKRLKIRSWRRGTKEMDLILGPFFDQFGADLDDGSLDRYEALLAENDQDLYQWFSEQAPVPVEHAGMLDLIRSRHVSEPGKA
ncbi:succinate dehydrogenase assembly factor 2 [Silicimonas sp. MF1-12-2]|uniref:FAD assembly factor SdhE n=1 Tax=Silicimonas sp. MF1-12-2 TaxID=3384793 RepID=UPI0039B61ECD